MIIRIQVTTVTVFFLPDVTKVPAENSGICAITGADTDLKKMIG